MPKNKDASEKIYQSNFVFTFVILFPSLILLSVVHGLLSLDVYFISPLWLLILPILPTIGWASSFGISLFESGSVFTMLGSEPSKKHVKHDDMFLVTTSYYGFLASLLNVIGWFIVFIRDQGFEESDVEGVTTFRDNVYGIANAVSFLLYLTAINHIVNSMRSAYVMKKSVQLAEMASNGESLT